jgi:hypothetical protein
MEENSRGKGLNIVVKLNTYLLPFVSFSFGWFNENKKAKPKLRSLKYLIWVFIPW